MIPVQEVQQSLDVEAIVDRARAVWRTALDRASTARVELFAKAALRYRVTRDLDGISATFDRVLESGLAMRALRPGHDRAGFAASSGLSAEVVRWAVDTACTYRAQAPASQPGPSDSVAAERWDLDAAVSLPGEETLTTALIARPYLEWIEAGTTVEVLIGAEGWLAARRRHRLWALGGGSCATLVAQRGLAGWERLLDSSWADDSFERRAVSAGLQVLVLTPDAASAVVAALVDAFHGTGPARWTKSGGGWDVVDEPVRPDGLTGGSFDDAGFPAVSRVLAADGFWVGRLGGPGTFRRASFREPPAESATNLVMASGRARSIPIRATVASRCRVLRPSPELWVLELDLVDAGSGGGLERRWVRVQPRALLAACAARLGKSTVTPAGPIVPALLFEGLAGS
jgi:hypothetical protein